MLDELQKAKLVEWAEWCLAHGYCDMPCGLEEVDCWIGCCRAGLVEPFPTFDRDEPYTFGEDHG